MDRRTFFKVAGLSSVIPVVGKHNYAKPLEIGESSEFGRGLVYCLGLFIAHQGMFKDDSQFKEAYWYNAATDHLAEIETSPIKDDSLRTEIDVWVGEMFKKRYKYNHNTAEIAEDVTKAKEFLCRIDRSVCGVDSALAEWG